MSKGQEIAKLVSDGEFLTQRGLARTINNAIGAAVAEERLRAEGLRKALEYAFETAVRFGTFAEETLIANAIATYSHGEAGNETGGGE